MEHTSIDSDVELYKYHSGAPSGDAYVKASQELIDRINRKLEVLGLDRVELDSVERPTAKITEGPQRLVAAYTDALLKQAENNTRLVALDADLILDTGLIPFEEKFPDRFIECGIAEQDMVSQAGGMALAGLLPVVHSFACFLTARPSEQIYNNSTEHTKIIYVGTLAGVTPGGPGHSHQGVRDISTMGSMPGLTVVEPSCEAEVTALLEWAVVENTGSSYIRLMSLPVVTNFSLPDDYVPQVGKGIQVTPGSDALIFAYGPQMLTNAVAASADIKHTSGLDVGVVNLPWLNTIDSAWLTSTIQTVPHIFCIDNHYAIGGLGDRMASVISSDPNINVILTSIGLNEVPVCGTNDEIVEFHGLSSDKLASSIIQKLLSKS
jgi:transketolase